MDLLALTVRQLVAHFAAGDFTVESYARALVTRIEATRDLNAYTSIHLEQILAHSRMLDKERQRGGKLGPLFGLPFAVKDNIDVAGMPTTAGTEALRHNVAACSAAVVERLTRAGAFVIGKNNMHELAFGITNNNMAYGPTRNPHNPDRIAGGSSGGTAAAVAAGAAPIGLGTDTGGSVRIPSALCGIAGFRPTTGRYPSGGIVPISRTRDTVGPIGKNVGDLAFLDSFLAGREAPEELSAIDWRKIRLGVPRDPCYQDLDPDVAQAAERALGWLRDLGATLVDVDMSAIPALNEAVSLPLCIHEMPSEVTTYLKNSGSRVTFDEIVAAIAGPDVRDVVGLAVAGVGTPEGREAYAEVLKSHLPALRKEYRRLFESHGLTALVFPTTPLPACPIGDDETTLLNGRRVPTFGTYIRNTDTPSNAGIPCISLPIGMSRAGLPIGLELDALWNKDRELLSLAADFEQAIAPELARLWGAAQA